MPPKGRQPHKKPQNRVRPTQRSIEAKQFSTVRMPRSNEVSVNTNAIHEAQEAVPSSTTAGGGFDPISSDGMFTVITNSKYWPPMPLEQLLERAPPELLGKVRVDDDRPVSGSDSDGSSSDDDSLNKAASSDDEENDNATGKASASPATSRSAVASKAERIKQILSSDGAMDLYDRRDDEAKARKMLAKARKVAGELSHPRGKAPVNTKKTFDDDSD